MGRRLESVAPSTAATPRCPRGSSVQRQGPDFFCSIVVVAAMTVAVTVAIPVTLVAMMPFAAFAVSTTTLLPVTLLHPLLLDKVHRLAASAVAPAVPGPVLPVEHWNVEVYRLLVDSNGRRHDDNRLWIHDNRWRVVSDVDSAVDPRLGNADRNADIWSCKHRAGGQNSQREYSNKSMRNLQKQQIEVSA